MGIQDWSENIILATVAPEPQMNEELKTVIRIVRDRDDCSVVVDFSAAELITSSSLAQLLRLRKMLSNKDNRLILCGLSSRSKGVFSVAGLEEVFEFVEDKFFALTSLQMDLQSVQS